LRGDWRIQAKNTAGNIYRSFECDGLLEGDRILLSVNGRSFCAGRIEPDAPLLCNWTLFDVIPALAKSGQGFTVLEDLEKPKRNCRLKPLGSWRHEEINLQGFALQGEGQASTYFWIDHAGNAAIMANAFNTFVLRAMEDDA
jgi:hypothetical protein